MPDNHIGTSYKRAHAQDIIRVKQGKRTLEHLSPRERARMDELRFYETVKNRTRAIIHANSKG